MALMIPAVWAAEMAGGVGGGAVVVAPMVGGGGGGGVWLFDEGGGDWPAFGARVSSSSLRLSLRFVTASSRRFHTAGAADPAITAQARALGWVAREISRLPTRPFWPRALDGFVTGRLAPIWVRIEIRLLQDVPLVLQQFQYEAADHAAAVKVQQPDDSLAVCGIRGEDLREQQPGRRRQHHDDADQPYGVDGAAKHYAGQDQGKIPDRDQPTGPAHIWEQAGTGQRGRTQGAASSTRLRPVRLRSRRRPAR